MELCYFSERLWFDPSKCFLAIQLLGKRRIIQREWDSDSGKSLHCLSQKYSVKDVFWFSDFNLPSSFLSTFPSWWLVSLVTWSAAACSAWPLCSSLEPPPPSMLLKKKQNSVGSTPATFWKKLKKKGELMMSNQSRLYKLPEYARNIWLKRLSETRWNQNFRKWDFSFGFEIFWFTM